MNWKPRATTPRSLPFRTASAGSGRPNLLEKLMMSRPKVADLPQTQAGNSEEQDAVLSGMTRSLQRRVSGLNVPIAIRSATVQGHMA